jgi:hypothetical protein
MHLFYCYGQSLSEKNIRPTDGPECEASPLGIDIHVEVPRVPFEKLSSQRTGEPFAKVRERVEAARAVQRFEETTLQTNADSVKPPLGMGPAEIRKFCPIDETSTNLLKAAMQQTQLSAHLITVSSNWPGRLQTWQDQSTFRRRTLPRPFSIGRGRPFE